MRRRLRLAFPKADALRLANIPITMTYPHGSIAGR